MNFTRETLDHHLTAEQRTLLADIICRRDLDGLARDLGWEMMMVIHEDDEDDEDEDALAAYYVRHSPEVDAVIANLVDAVLSAEEDQFANELEHAFYEEAGCCAAGLRHTYGRAYLDTRDTIDGEDLGTRLDTHDEAEADSSDFLALWRRVSEIGDEYDVIIDTPPTQVGYADVAKTEHLCPYIDAIIGLAATRAAEGQTWQGYVLAEAKLLAKKKRTAA